jgi:hypothetical protein
VRIFGKDGRLGRGGWEEEAYGLTSGLYHMYTERGNARRCFRDVVILLS